MSDKNSRISLSIPQETRELMISIHDLFLLDKIGNRTRQKHGITSVKFNYWIVKCKIPGMAVTRSDSGHPKFPFKEAAKKVNLENTGTNKSCRLKKGLVNCPPAHCVVHCINDCKRNLLTKKIHQIIHA